TLSLVDADSHEPALTIDADPAGDIDRRRNLDALRHAVIALPARYREAVVLCDLHELSYADAAATLGCAIGTVRSRLHRGRALLARRFCSSPVAQPRPLNATRILS